MFSVLWYFCPIKTFIGHKSRMTAMTNLPARLPPSADGQLTQIDRDRLQEAMANSRSAATRRVYASQWRLWCDWAAERGLSLIPATPVAVANFLIERADLGVTVSTVRTARAAIAAMHRDAGHSDPTDNEGVRRVMAGLSRTIGKRQEQAAPLTRDVQVAIQATASFPRPLPSGRLENPRRALARAKLDIALVAVMRDGLLRRSEAANLAWGDVEFMEDGSGRITVRNSKTDQLGEGALLYLGPNAVNALNGIRPGQPNPADKVFRLSARQIGRRISAAAAAAGVSGNFAGHSPRVGMAIDLAAGGCELPALMTAGRWESPTMPARYTRAQAAGRGAVARYYGLG